MARRSKFQAPSGMHDILPADYFYFQKIQKICENTAHFYNFQRIETPVAEQVELFSRGIGLTTDIVEKQMYTLRTKGGDLLALRPEGTAPVARAYIEHGMHNLPQPVKLWYFSPFFRYERPQAGRYRQFWQFGFEVFGEQTAVIDAQVILIFYNILKELKFKNLVIEINSIGDKYCRPYYKKILVSYFRSRESSLCANCRKRLRENPLRILDCKEEKCQRIISQAPQMIDHLCEECKSHFKQVLEFLDELDLPYHLNPYLVRGLDYYTKTVFEIFDQSLPEESPEEKAHCSPTVPTQHTAEGLISPALVGGGRCDLLTKILGGKDVPACGGAAGVERIIQNLKAKQRKIGERGAAPSIFLAQLGDLAKKKSLVLAEEFRKAGLAMAESFGKDSLKTQLSRADKIGVKYCLILGQKEALEGTCIIRDMQTGAQETVKTEKIVAEVKKRLKK